MAIKPEDIKIEIGCDEWDQSINLKTNSPREAEKLGLANPAELMVELLTINHQRVLACVLSHYEALIGLSNPTMNQKYEVSLYFTSSENIQQINLNYRAKDNPTNVLSFESDLPAEILTELACQPLGELVFSLEVVFHDHALERA